MSTMILPCRVFSRELPMIDGTTMSETIHNIISSHFEIYVMNVYFKYFLSIIIENRLHLSWVHPSWIHRLSIRVIWILFEIIAISSLIQIIFICVLLIFTSHLLLNRTLLHTFLRHVVVLNSHHILFLVMIVVCRISPLVLHSHVLMIHWVSITSILSTIVLVLRLSATTLLPPHWLAMMIIRWYIVHIPNRMVVIIHLSSIWLPIILSAILHFALIIVVLIHLTF